MRSNRRAASVVLALACALTIVVVPAVPAQAAKGNNGKGGKHYTVRQGPCQLDSMPTGASHLWTPGGESIVHKVSYGEGLQQIAWDYGFKGDMAYKRLWDANPQLNATWLERAGITIRIPACGTTLRPRALPEPPPEPEPEPEPEVETAQAAEPEQEAAPAPQPEPDPAPAAPAVPSGSVWDSLAQCESGGNWSINTGNGYYGGLQFSLSSWQAVGGSSYPHEHSREEQIRRGEMLQAQQGWGAWPSCAAKLGLL
ncbi:MAG TPA: transglycosylase family protein [Euzebyales bacterium]